MTLHDELRELVNTYGQGLLEDADLFRAALDDYLPENAALPGQLNVLHDAVRFGAYERCVQLLSRGSEPMLAVSTAGDLLARERGTTEVITSRWAVASLAHATGHLATDALSAFLRPDTAGGPLRDPAPSVPNPPGPQSGTGPPGPAPSYPPPQSIPPPPSVPPPTANPAPPLPPTYLPPVETAPGAPPSWPAPEQPSEPAQTSTPAPAAPPTNSEPVPQDPSAASSTPLQPQTVKAPLGRGALLVPPGTAREEPRRRSRRAGLLAAAAVAAVVAAGVGAYLVVADRDDDDTPGPTAKDSATPGSPSNPTSSGRSTPSAPLTAPDAPKLGAAPAYRSVAFTVKGEVVGQENVLLQMWSDDGWTETDPEFAVPTAEGGDPACARVRAVRAVGDQRAAGPAARLCGKSKPRTVELVRSDAGCPPDAPASSLACYAFDLSVAGFKPGKAEMRILGATYQGTYQACERKCTKPVSVDSSGRGQLKGAMYAFDGQSVTVEVDGLPETVAVG